MPARLNLSDDELGRRVREQTRLRVKRYRARRNVTGPHTKEARNVTPPQTPPVREALSLEEATGVGAILEPFAGRGYKPNPRFWAKMAAKYPALDLELEALKLADWLLEPRNAKKRCSTARIDNWLGIEEAKRLQRRAGPATTNGVYHPPATRQRTPDPDGLPVLEADLERIDPAERDRALAEARRVPYKERLALAKGGKR